MPTIRESIQKYKSKNASSGDFQLIVSAITEEILSKKIEELEKDIEEELKKLAQKVSGVKEEVRIEVEKAIQSREIQRIIREIIDAFILKGLRGLKGEKGDIGPQGLEGKEKQGPKGERGNDYILAAKDKREIADIIPRPENGRDGSPDAPLQIADKINTLTEKIQQKTIIGLESMFRNLHNSIRESKQIVRGGGDIVNYYDLTSQCNGILKTFTIPKNRKVVGVFGGQFPINLRPLVDWTYTTTTLTLTSQISAPETGQTLYIIYIK